MSDCYTVSIERLSSETNSSYPQSYFGGKLRFEVTSSTLVDPNDSNNNADNLERKNLASFELFEHGIQSIIVVPVADNSFSVECSKSSSPSADKSGSVEVIHRAGSLKDSNENVATIYLTPEKNLLPPGTDRCVLSTFHTGQMTKYAQGNPGSSTSINEISKLNLDDLRQFTRFTYKFIPILDTVHNGNEEGDEYNNGTPPLLTAEEEMREEAEQSVKFTANFENLISITVEITNLFVQSLSPTPPEIFGEQMQIMGDLFFPYDNTTQEEPSPKFRDLNEMARVQSHRSHVRYNLPNRVIVLRKFVKCLVRYRLQSLGIQHLDCNEVLDAWEAKLEGPFFTPQSLHYGPELSSPFTSKPNSSLFRLSPSGHITKSIFSTFISQVESLKGILNNATCNLIHTSVSLLLPEIKLLWGRQLETNRNPIFIQEWVRLIELAGTELQPIAPEEVEVMISKELKSLKSLSKELHKGTKKVFRKIETLSKFSEENFRKTLSSLNPKSLKKLDAFDANLRKKYSPDALNFDADQLHKIPLTPSDLFRKHLFLSETPKGELLVKVELEGVWGKYRDLAFAERRTIFLSLTEDLSSSLKSCLNTIQHLKEIYTVGYPGSIKNLLKDVVHELKLTSKRDDLTLLIKTSIVTHVACLHEMLARLLLISQEVKGVTKQLKEALLPLNLDLKKLRRAGRKGMSSSCGGGSSDDVVNEGNLSLLSGYRCSEVASGIGHSNPQLTIPFYSQNGDLTFNN